MVSTGGEAMAATPLTNSDIEELVQKASRKNLIQDIFTECFDDYLAKHTVSMEKQKVVKSIINCKTGAFGYTLSHCPNCGRNEIHLNSCGNRNCPVCGGLRKLQWIRDRESEIIEGIYYYHATFTIPHELNPFFYAAPRPMLSLLYDSAWATVRELCLDRKKFIPGVVAVIHTFGSNMSLHPHVHMLISGGGITPDGKKFRQCKAKYLLPVKVMSALFRGKFLDGIKKLRNDGSIPFANGCESYRNWFRWKELLNFLYRKEFNIDIKRIESGFDAFAPESRQQRNTVAYLGEYTAHTAISTDRILTYTSPEDVPDAENVEDVLDYFSTYLEGTAVTENRVLSCEDGRVTFLYTDYDDGGKKKQMSLSAEEFIRRFLMHILPKGFPRVRYFGFLAGSVKNKKLEFIRSFLYGDDTGSDHTPEKKTAAQFIREYYGRDITKCRHCHHELEVITVNRDYRILGNGFDARAA